MLYNYVFYLHMKGKQQVLELFLQVKTNVPVICIMTYKSIAIRDKHLLHVWYYLMHCSISNIWSDSPLSCMLHTAMANTRLKRQGW